MSHDAAIAKPVLPEGALFRAAREARAMWALGARVRLLVDSGDTGGTYSLIEVYLPPETDGPPLHTHTDADELFFMLEGGLKITIAEQGAGEQIVVLRAGDTFIAPRKTLHTFANPYLSPCRFLTQYTPGGFERFFVDVGVEAKDMFRAPQVPIPTPQQMRSLAVKHHMGVPGLTT